MTTFRANFVSGILVGVALAIAAPLAGAEFFTSLSGPAIANTTAAPTAAEPQIVNRAGKSDRLHPALPVQKATDGAGPKRPKIPDGCDPAFSPLSKGAGSNFSGRCLT